MARERTYRVFAEYHDSSKDPVDFNTTRDDIDSIWVLDEGAAILIEGPGMWEGRPSKQVFNGPFRRIRWYPYVE